MKIFETKYLCAQDAQPWKTIDLNESIVEPAPYLKKPYAFHVQYKKKHYYFLCDSNEDRTDWINALKVFAVIFF